MGPALEVVFRRDQPAAPRWVRPSVLRFRYRAVPLNTCRAPCGAGERATRLRCPPSHHPDEDLERPVAVRRVVAGAPDAARVPRSRGVPPVLVPVAAARSPAAAVAAALVAVPAGPAHAAVAPQDRDVPVGPVRPVAGRPLAVPRGVGPGAVVGPAALVARVVATTSRAAVAAAPGRPEGERRREAADPGDVTTTSRAAGALTDRPVVALAVVAGEG